MPEKILPTIAAANGALAGIRVLDLTSVVLGPLATQVLGDYGAEIIKIEGLTGDLMRSNGVSLHRGMSSIFLSINRNKRSIAIDLKSDEGRAVMWSLIDSADVLVHNMRVQAIEKLGFGREAAMARKPGLIYCVATGFDQDGPDHAKPAFDDVIQAACGLADLNAMDRGEPTYVPSLIADKTAGMAVANAVLAALVHKFRTGRGQHVEVPMFETLVAFMLAEHLGGLTFDPPPTGAGYARLLAGGRKPVRTADGFIAMLPYTEDHWVAFFERNGRPELIAELGIHDRLTRNANIAKLYAALVEITCTRTTAQWLAICAELDIPATPIYRFDDLPRHPQLAAVGLFQDASHPSEGPIRYVRPAAKFSDSPTGVFRHAPLLGQHSREILRELGFDGEQIVRLEDNGVVFQA